MKKVSFILGIISLVVGFVLLGFSLYRYGFSLSIGVLVGILLVLNGLFRLWIARGARVKKVE